MKIKFSFTGWLFKSKQQRENERLWQVKEKIFSTDTPMSEVDKLTNEALELISKHSKRIN